MKMKKIVILGLIVVTCMMMAGCKGKEEKKNEDQKTAEQSQEQTSDTTDTASNELPEEEGASTAGVDGVPALCTDDKSVSITINRPEGFKIPNLARSIRLLSRGSALTGRAVRS